MEIRIPRYTLKYEPNNLLLIQLLSPLHGEGIRQPRW